jgi:hypothetical protein
MSRGLLDYAGLPLELADQGLATLGLPPLLHVLLWGALAGFAGMWLYRRCSPQARLEALGRELTQAQAELAAHDGEFAELWKLVRHQLGLALRRLRLSAVAALLAGVPVLLTLPWLSNHYALQLPIEGSPLQVCAVPAAAATSLQWSTAVGAADAQGCWQLPWPSAQRPLRLSEQGREQLHLPLPAVDVVHKRQGWNWLIGNPAGYLPDPSQAELIRLDFSTREVFPFGPVWLRGWLPWYFAAALLISLLLRWRWRLS